MFTDTEVALMANQNDLKKALIEARKQLAEAKATIKAKDGAIEGLIAQVNAMRDAHPNSPMLAASNQIWQGGQYKGKAKTKLRLIYEATHDAALRKLGVANPERIRSN
jgi:3-dehydroquinate dehydratase